MPTLFVLTVLAFFLTACSEPQVEVKPAKPSVQAYLQNLQVGDRDKLLMTYFMPLHWRVKEKVYKAFDAEHQALAEGKLKLSLLDLKQSGRWAVAVLRSEKQLEDGSWQTTIEPAWFFFYDGRWQYISPAIYKTGPVRNMMDLFREQEALQEWFWQQKQQLEAQLTKKAA
jgi:hypothetical protein